MVETGLDENISKRSYNLSDYRNLDTARVRSRYYIFGLSYSNIIKRLDRTPGEIFYILECCKGGGAALNSEYSEFILASAANLKYSADGTPAAANYRNSFIDAIKIWRRNR